MWGTYFGSSSSDNDQSTGIVVNPDRTYVYVVGMEDAIGLTFGSTDILMTRFNAEDGT